MLPLAKNDTPSAKCIFTRGFLPAYIDEVQGPSKRKPFSSLLVPKCYHTIDLLLPAEVREVVQRKIEAQIQNIQYAKVMMSLGDIISGDFFTSYVKKGNIIMLGEGRPGVDNLYSLHEGILALELDKPTYERVGLVGKPIPDGGRKHKKTRYLIEINLRLPSMLHGKKGFERVVWAFKNVLNQSLTWLFYDLESTKDDGSRPVNKHQPLWLTATPEATTIIGARIPILPASTTSTTIIPSAGLYNDHIFLAELEDWISLACLDSSRILDKDVVDPFICRYAVPDSGETNAHDQHYNVHDLVRLRWHGFVPASVARKIFIVAERAAKEQWVALQVHGFRGEALTVMKLPAEGKDEAFLEWAHSARL